MSKAPSMKVLGLYSAPNLLNAPDGALLQADNCVIRNKDLIEPRRGQELLADAGGVLGGTDYANTLVAWNGGMYGHFGTNHVMHYSGAGWDSIGSTHNAPDPTLLRMKFLSALERLYFTTDAGVFRTTGSAAKIAAGNQAVIDWADSHAAKDTNGFLAVGQCVAYRATLRDLVGTRWVVGPASGRAIINNHASVDVAIGGFVRTGGNLVTVTAGAAHGLKYGDTFDVTPGEANFAAGTKTVTQILSNNVFTYAEAGSNTASTALETVVVGNFAKATIRVLLPANATTSTVVELWRSQQVAIGDTPSEDLYQVFQGYPSATDISNGFMDVVDNTPEVLLGDPGYFTPAVEGILANNDAPPLAKDICLFGDVMVMGNLVEKHSLQVRLLSTGTGGSAALASGDVITFTRGGSNFGVTMAHNQTGGQAVVYNNGSIADDIEKTAQAIVDAVNSHSSNTFIDAFYISGDQDAPGLMLFRARDFSTTQFTVSVSAHSTAFNPDLSATKTLARSTQVSMAHGVAWSKPSKCDACPGINRQPIGDALEKVLRVVALRDKVLIVKERSAWLMTGSYGNFRFSLLDNTVRVVGADTVAVLNNQVHALTTQGVATITEVGVGLLTPPVFADFESLVVNNIANVRTVAWGAAYETEHQYLLGIPGSSKVQYVYVWNTLTHAWTRWPMARTCATVDVSTDLLWMGDSNNATARRERKQFSVFDYEDEKISKTLTSASGTVLNLTSDASVAVGDYIELQTNSSIRSRVVSIAGDGHHVTVADTLTWGSSVAVWLDKAFTCDVKWVPVHFGSPGTDKTLSQVTLHMRDASFATGALYYATDVVPSEVASGALSTNSTSGPANVLSQPSRDMSYSAYFSLRWHITEALATWKLQGLTPDFKDSGSTRTQR